MTRPFRLPARLLLVGTVALGACTAESSDEPEASTPALSTSVPLTTTSDPPASSSAPAASDSGGTDPAPARRVPSQVSSETGHWLGIVGMTDDMIELAWSEVDADDVVHQIFRFETGDGLDRERVELADPIHEGIGGDGWVDETVETGRFYTYVMRVIADDEVLQRRWADGLAVTDEAPPSPVGALTATITDEGVFLEWAPSDDDVEFGSYGVYRTDLVGSPYIGGGGDRTVTSFIDDDVPASGEIGYEVVAFDFHGNRSSPTTITVDLG